MVFQVLNEKNDILLSGLEPESISDYTEKSTDLLSNAKELDQYEVIEESPDVFVIYLTDDSGTKMARTAKEGEN